MPQMQPMAPTTTNTAFEHSHSMPVGTNIQPWLVATTTMSITSYSSTHPGTNYNNMSLGAWDLCISPPHLGMQPLLPPAGLVVVPWTRGAEG